MKSATELSEGMTDAGRAWRNTIRFSGTPESLALSTNSQFMASIKPARNSRLRWATCPIMTVIAGMIETLSNSQTEASANTRISAGNSGIQTAKKMMRRVPMTKSGMEYPIIAREETTASGLRPR